MVGSTERLIYISLLVVLGIIALIALRRRSFMKPIIRGLDDLVEKMGEGYLGLDREGRIVAANAAYLRMSGYRLGDLLGTSIERLLVSDHPQELVQRMKQVEAAKTSIYRAHHRAKDGSLLPIEVSITAMGDGSPIAFVCFYRDLREQQRAQEQAQHVQDLMRYVIDHSFSAIALFDTQMRYIMVSKKYLQEYQLSDEAAIIGRSHYDVIKGIPDRWKEIHRRALGGEVLNHDGDFFVNDDGTVMHTRWECRPWYNADQTIGGMVLYTQDIGAIIEFQRELFEARDYLSALITRSNTPIVVWDKDLVIQRANPAFARLFGIELGSLIGRSLTALKAYVNHDIHELVKRLFVTGRDLSSMEIELTLSDGTTKHVVWTATLIHDSDSKEVQAVIAQGQDISELKKMQKESDDQLAMLQRWYAVMAHREERIMELKEEVNEALRSSGQARRYRSMVEQEDDA